MKTILTRIKRRSIREGNRFYRRLWQWWHVDPWQPKTPVFILGMQRSGTNMLLGIIGNSPFTTWFGEQKDNPAFHHFRLRAQGIIARLIERSPGLVVVLKPINDSHFADQFLARYPGAKILWIYRRYQDVANSAFNKWGSGYHEGIIRRIATGEWQTLNWNSPLTINEGWDTLDWGERLPPEIIAIVRHLYHDGITGRDHTALLWYIRNQLFFQLNLQQSDRVLLVRYEDLVKNPQREAARIFEFLGIPFRSHYIRDIFSSSVRKQPAETLHPNIHSLCEQLTQRLDKEYARKKHET